MHFLDDPVGSVHSLVALEADRATDLLFGDAHAKKPEARWLRPGELIEVETESIGICANRVVDEDNFATRTAAERCGAGRMK
ncbi:hypothetical protein [Ruegeria marina]|uniref:Uncharacterized protein n=1 Tax=Ruegeria marina TaxID=639004 RepID=A0A1G7EKP0_9RHOB|nr:hypothetical protein [Ruegeria marina]SDE64243.1 hypothetical protein SAMN04488239_1265 [Ruegeria marina]